MKLEIYFESSWVIDSKPSFKLSFFSFIELRRVTWLFPSFNRNIQQNTAISEYFWVLIEMFIYLFEFLIFFEFESKWSCISSIFLFYFLSFNRTFVIKLNSKKLTKAQKYLKKLKIQLKIFRVWQPVLSQVEFDFYPSNSNSNRIEKARKFQVFSSFLISVGFMQLLN